MKPFALATALAFAVILTACGTKEEYTVDYLQNNNEVRAKVLEDCKANKQTDSNCKNANKAEKIVKTEAFKKHMFGK